MRRIIFGIGAAFALFVVISILSGSWYTIDQGERGVILRNGAVIGTAEPGLGFKVPIIDDVVEISIQNHSRLYEQVQAYSRDQQPADIKISVNYHLPVDRVADIYAQYGGESGVISRLVDRKVNEEAKNIFGQFNAERAIQERAALNKAVSEAITSSVLGPIIIDSVQIENIDFSDAYEQSVEQRMLAEVEVAKFKQNVQRKEQEARMTVIAAEAERDAVKARADAEAYQITAKGNAEANAIKARAAALQENPNLVTLVYAEKWNGVLPTTMVPGAAVPFVNVK